MTILRCTVALAMKTVDDLLMNETRLVRLLSPSHLMVVIGALVLCQCAPRYTLVSQPKSSSLLDRMHETFGYRKWVSATAEPDVVIIGIHGFCGAAIDYENLGLDLLKNQPQTALYAYEVRGQGSDPLKERRGDIDDPKLWYRDLLTFTGIVHKHHPDAKIIWMGESMGGLIASHTWQQSIGKKPPCDALILSSPVVKIRADVPMWKKEILKLAAAAAPTGRISIETLAGGQSVQMTHTSTHNEQAETNSWNIDEHTFRLLAALSDHIESMNTCAESFHLPILVLHGGKDFFTEDSAVQEFMSHIPKSTPKTLRYYPDAYHLLMYDDRKDLVIRDVERWVTRFRSGL
jgi:alpha-beta hydrolase superfamily lysophospholipase